MVEQKHVSSQFDEDIDRLRQGVFRMGGTVEEQLKSVLAAYESGDDTLIRHVIETDRAVNDLEKLLDEDCAEVIALRQPAASDLRMILGIRKIVTDLERCGDEAKKIAKGLRRILEQGQTPQRFGSGIRHLGDSAQRSVQQAIDALARLDVESAFHVIDADADVDIQFKSIVRQLITHMIEDPRTISTSIEIIDIARALERIGDHAKNIAEHVVFIVEGRDVRYLGKKKKPVPDGG